jgi:hypothetical protein
LSLSLDIAQRYSRKDATLDYWREIGEVLRKSKHLRCLRVNFAVCTTTNQDVTAALWGEEPLDVKEVHLCFKLRNIKIDTLKLHHALKGTKFLTVEGYEDVSKFWELAKNNPVERLSFISDSYRRDVMKECTQIREIFNSHEIQKDVDCFVSLKVSTLEEGENITNCMRRLKALLSNIILSGTVNI